MKTLIQLETILKKNKKEIFQKYQITELGIFGSYVRGEQTVNSDIDILIDYDRKGKFTLFDLISLQTSLSELLSTKVDIALKKKLKPVMGYYILREIIYL